VSAEDLERDAAACKSALAMRDALKQELLLKEEGSRVEDIQAAEADVQRRRALLELARNRFNYTVVRSPIEGVVLERYVTPGTYIPAGNPRIVSLYDPKDLQVRVDVRQENIAAVFVGQEVEVFTDVEPGRAYTGTVIRIEPLADFKKNTIQVKVKLHDPSEKLYPEMIARIRFMRKDNDEDHGQG
jgi:HlyD family secretion protein